ncbi:hypothetical protein PR048_008298 [Dryococelus australis]|uniref:RanBP2-type domain-containing protein n=1 Tax=Dryococelus australis TaxID=614101 RepID=A0ABQ9HWQ3_9NEOP|nr:hypothetical protein PR048_008298 [Dryococelus australis]
MAQLNCPSCNHGMMWVPNNQWDFNFPHGRTASNLSINVPPSPHGYPTPEGGAFVPMGTWHGPPPGMYPPQWAFPAGMSASQANLSQHQHQHRAPSPAHSTKSMQAPRRGAISPPHSVKSSQPLRRRANSPAHSVRTSQSQQRQRVVSPQRKVSYQSRSSLPRRIHSNRKMLTDSSDEEEVFPQDDEEMEDVSDERNEDLSDIDDCQEMAVEERSPPPPQPIVPSHQWECEHCTFVNRAGVRVCAMCCKTPSNLSHSPKKPPAVSKNKQLQDGESIRESQRSSEVGAKRHHHRSSDDSYREQSDSPYDESLVVAKFNKQLRISQKSEKPAEEDPYESVRINSSGSEMSNANKTGNNREEIFQREKEQNEMFPGAKIEFSDVKSTLSPTVSDPLPRTTNSSSDAHSQTSFYSHSSMPASSEMRPTQANSTPHTHVAKVSTAVGPSPPREIVPGGSAPEYMSDTRKISASTGTQSLGESHSDKLNDSAEQPKKKMVTSTGTSPPPQSISTQTYEVAQALSGRSSSLAGEGNDTDGRYQSAGAGGGVRRLKRAMSLHIGTQTRDDDQWAAYPSYLYRSQSRHSLMSDTQSLSLSHMQSRDTSPHPSFDSRYIDDEVMAYTERNLGPYSPGSNRRRESFHDTRSRSISGAPRKSLPSSDFSRSQLDLRISDIVDSHRTSYPNHAGFDNYQRQDLQPQVVGNHVSRASSQTPESRLGSKRPEYLSNLEDLVQKQRSEALKSQGMELVQLLREAEQHHFSPEELQVAMSHCGDKSPVQWLQDNWRNMIDTVVTLATNYGHERKENNVGTVSVKEARDALRQHKGNIWAAVTECVEQRQKKYAELFSRGNFTREDIVTVLTANHGNLEAAYLELSKTQLKPFLMRIWGPPTGTDNESGNIEAESLDKLYIAEGGAAAKTHLTDEGMMHFTHSAKEMDLAI